MPKLTFALNHMVAPSLPVEAFFDLAAQLGLRAVEIRNDLAGNAILDGTPPGEVRRLAQAKGLDIISINALQRFNDWTDERGREAESLIAYASGCGARALVLVPVNDGSGCADGERQANAEKALVALKPMLSDAGIVGLVEPLGFDICSLRSKREAAAAIEAVGGHGVFKLVHDTFHHHLAGEPDIFPDLTGLVHISGVTEEGLEISDMRDSHRVLVDSRDRLDNIGQIRALTASGYQGPFSFEPFAAEVHALGDPQTALRESMDFIQAAP